MLPSFMRLPSFIKYPPAAEPTECPGCELRRKTLIHMHTQMQSTKSAYSGLARRVSRFQKDHPELWRLYFTKAGDAEREAAGDK